MNLNPAIRKDLSRALRTHAFELADDGRLLLPKAGLFIGGVARTDVNGQDRHVLPNLFSKEGLIDVLKVAFKQASQATAFYLAPFSGNVDPADTLTAANFAATQTEFTDYSQTTRVAWTPGDPTTPDIGNDASLAQFTISTAGSTVWGFALLSAAAKSATTGKLYSCFKEDTARDNLRVGDKLNVDYTITGQDAG